MYDLLLLSIPEVINFYYNDVLAQHARKGINTIITHPWPVPVPKLRPQGLLAMVFSQTLETRRMALHSL